MAPHLVLFDIDGTLLTARGLGRRSLERAFRERFGRDRVFDGITFHGRTDPEILRDGLAVVGAGAEALPDLLDGYLAHLEREVAVSVPLLLPGVREILDRLAGDDRVVTGLVTGNVRRGARIKLGRDGLFESFRVGAFGDDSEDRGALVRLATRRAEELQGRAFSRVFHVGDTASDVLAARAAGACAVAVATGGEDAERLAALAPDHLFASLDPAEPFLEAVLP